jgi:DNA-binding PadR family transcriptional regulator
LKSISGKRTLSQGRVKQIAIAIADNGALTNSGLQNILKMKRQQVCKCLVPLREAGYVAGSKRRNKRFTYYGLTAEGRAWLDELGGGSGVEVKFYDFKDDPAPESGDIDYQEWKRAKEIESDLSDLLSEAENAAL